MRPVFRVITGGDDHAARLWDALVTAAPDEPARLRARLAALEEERLASSFPAGFDPARRSVNE